jgi:hypothetical protein
MDALVDVVTVDRVVVVAVFVSVAANMAFHRCTEFELMQLSLAMES